MNNHTIELIRPLLRIERFDNLFLGGITVAMRATGRMGNGSISTIYMVLAIRIRIHRGRVSRSFHRGWLKGRGSAFERKHLPGESRVGFKLLITWLRRGRGQEMVKWRREGRILLRELTGELENRLWWWTWHAMWGSGWPCMQRWSGESRSSFNFNMG